jgi:hypothetical protein
VCLIGELPVHISETLILQGLRLKDDESLFYEYEYNPSHYGVLHGLCVALFERHFAFIQRRLPWTADSKDANLVINDHKDSPIGSSTSGFKEKLVKVEMGKAIFKCVAIPFGIFGYLPCHLL